MTEKNHKSFLPITNGERFIATCLVCFFLTISFGGFGRLTTWGLDFSEIFSSLKLHALLSMGYLGLCVGISTMIIIGLRKVRLNGISYETLRMPALGIALCFCFTFFAWDSARVCKYRLKLIQETRQFMTKPLVQYEGIDPKSNPLLSKPAASLRFIYLGSITEYIDPNGETKIFEPTEEDRQIRKGIKRGIEILESGRSTMRRIMYTWMACGLASVLLGVFWPIRSKSSNSI